MKSTIFAILFCLFFSAFSAFSATVFDTIVIEIPEGGSFWFVDTQLACPRGTQPLFRILPGLNQGITMEDRMGTRTWIAQPGTTQVQVPTGCKFLTPPTILPPAPKKSHAAATILPFYAGFVGSSAWWWPGLWILLATLAATFAFLVVLARSKRSAALRINPADPQYLAQPMIQGFVRNALFPLLPARASDIEAAHQRAAVQIATHRPVGTHTDTWDATCVPGSDVNAPVESRRGTQISTMRSGSRYMGSLKVYRDLSTGNIMNVSFIFRVCANTFREMNSTDAVALAHALSWPSHSRTWIAATFSATTRGQVTQDVAWREIETWMRTNLPDILAASHQPATSATATVGAPVLGPNASTSQQPVQLPATTQLTPPTTRTTTPTQPATPAQSAVTDIALTEAQRAELREKGYVTMTLAQVQTLLDLGANVVMDGAVSGGSRGVVVRYFGIGSIGLPTDVTTHVIPNPILTPTRPNKPGNGGDNTATQLTTTEESVQ